MSPNPQTLQGFSTIPGGFSPDFWTIKRRISMVMFWFPIDQPLGDRSPILLHRGFFVVVSWVPVPVEWQTNPRRCSLLPHLDLKKCCKCLSLGYGSLLKSRWFKIIFSSSKWRSLILWKGDLTVQKWSQRLARMVFLYSNLSFKQALSFKVRLHLTRKFVAKRGF